MDLNGKCVLLGVSGGIAAYKMPNVASALRKAGAEVHVVMTQYATQFITPLTFESLTNHRCVVDTFARDFQYDIAHISLATAADLILVAPATADVIAKLAHGIAERWAVGRCRNRRFCWTTLPGNWPGRRPWPGFG